MEAIPGGLKALKSIRAEKNGGEQTLEGEPEQPLSPTSRLFHKPGEDVYIVAILGTKTKICPDIVKVNLVHTLLKNHRFTSLQVVDKENGGEMRWVKTEVNLENHIIVPELDPNMALPNKFVEDYISNLSKTTIDISKQPLWDLHLLNIRTSGAEATMIFRVHHSIGDGMSLLSLFRRISDPEAFPTIPASRSDRVDGFWPMLGLVWNTIVGMMMFLMSALFLKDTKTPLKGPPGVEFKPRRFIRRTVNLEDVKLVKNAMNMTINDVVLGVIQAGLTGYLSRRYGEGNSKEKRNNIPNNIRLRVTVMYNIRPPAGIHALAEMKEKGAKCGWGNKISYVLLPLTIAIRGDPLDYVREVKAAMDRKKASLEPLVNFLLAKFVPKFIGIKATCVINHRVLSSTTLCFSNVAGLREEVALFGHEIAYVAPTTYGQPMALMIHVMSYMNKLTFVLSADEGTIPDPQQLGDELEDSLKLIKDSVLREFVKDV